MTRYLVTTEMTIEAEDPRQAAMKVFALHDTMTPEELYVMDVDTDDDFGPSKLRVELEQTDKDEARRAYAAGEYFEEIKI